MNRIGIVFSLLLLALVGCRHEAVGLFDETTFSTGDLLFVADSAGMGSAIQSATGNYTHVAVVVRGQEGLSVYEALPKEGVTKCTLAQWMERQDTALLRTHPDYIVHARATESIDTSRLKRLLEQRLGSPYDRYFAAGNDMYYCSELVEESLFTPEGEKLFETQPMNFLDAEGKMPHYWEEWFDSLGTAVPQGMPGTNPNDLSRSPRLRRVAP